MKKSVTYKMIAEAKAIQDLSNRLNAQVQAVKSGQLQGAALVTAQQEIATLKGQIQRKQVSSDKKRTGLIKKIEEITHRPLLTFFSELVMHIEDAGMIEDILRSTDTRDGFDLLINNPGGYPEAAERIIHICRHYARCEEGKDWNVIVADRAKSAATIVALGATRILMTKTAELGPIDPQLEVFLANGQKVPVSAHQIFYGFENLLNKTKGEGVSDLEKQIYGQMATKYEPQLLERARTAILLTDKIAQTLNPATRGDLSLFKDHEQTCSHGRPIFLKDLADKSYVKGVCEYYNNDSLDSLFWELCVRSEAVSKQENIVQVGPQQFGKQMRKLYETSAGTLVGNRTMF